jgi:hypothetical protein
MAMTVNFPIINRAAIPDTAIIDGAVIDRQIPVIVRTPVGIAITAGIGGK